MPRIVVLVGLPGSGKSTWLARQPAAGLSSDELRRLLTDDPAHQGIHRRVFATLRHLLRQRIELGRPVTYIDATNLTRRERRPYVAFARLYECTAEALFFDVPLEACLERNRARTRQVPEEALIRMAGYMQRPDVAEGFSRVDVING